MKLSGVCLPVSLPVCLSVSVRVFHHLPATHRCYETVGCLSVCLSARLSVCLSARLSVSVCVFHHLPTTHRCYETVGCLSVCLSPSVCLSLRVFLPSFTHRTSLWLVCCCGPVDIIIIIIDIFRVAQTMKTIARTTVLEGKYD